MHQLYTLIEVRSDVCIVLCEVNHGEGEDFDGVVAFFRSASGCECLRAVAALLLRNLQLSSEGRRASCGTQNYRSECRFLPITLMLLIQAEV